jgi:ATP-dependent helicase HrpA
VSVLVPLALLAQLRPDGFDWQVPGLRDELVTALLRALPKTIRRNVVPAADWAERFAADLSGRGPEDERGLPATTLVAALAALVQRVANQPVTAADFELERVPAHLLPTFRAIDARGRTVGSDRDLSALQARLSEKARTSVAATIDRGAAQVAAARPGGAPGGAPAFPARSGVTAWDFGDLPDVVDTRVAGGVVRGYPAIVDDGASVSLRLETTAADAAAASRAGVRRLLLLAVPSPATYVLEHLTSAEKLALAASPYPNAKALIEDARRAVADAVLARTSAAGGVRTAAAFDSARDAFSAVVVDDTFAAVGLAAKVLTAAREVERALKAQNSLTLLAALGDVRGQLSGLVFPGFVSAIGLARLAHVPRYLAAALERVRGLSDNPGRDRQRQTEYERSAVAYTEAGGTIPVAPEASAGIAHARWLLEELRVSLFAQRLGTAEPVSAQRILKALRD